MTWIFIFGLLVVLMFHAMRSLSGVQLLVMGVLGIGLLWPVTTWVIRATAIHQAARVVRQTDVSGTTIPVRSLTCRVWDTLDKHEKNGHVRDRIRQFCDTEHDQ